METLRKLRSQLRDPLVGDAKFTMSKGAILSNNRNEPPKNANPSAVLVGLAFRASGLSLHFSPRSNSQKSLHFGVVWHGYPAVICQSVCHLLAFSLEPILPAYGVLASSALIK